MMHPKPEDAMTTEKIAKMRKASYLLPPPGGEVVRECLDEIERLQAAMQNVETLATNGPDPEGRLYKIWRLAKRTLKEAT